MRGRRRGLVHARLSRGLEMIATPDELIRPLEAQRFASGGTRGIELLNVEVDLDAVAAPREHIGETHDVTRAARRALRDFFRLGDRWLADALNETTLTESVLHGAGELSLVGQAANARQLAPVEQQRERGIVHIERGTERGLIHGNASIGVQRRNAQVVPAREMIVLTRRAGGNEESECET